jgi:hypothetical protein
MLQAAAADLGNSWASALFLCAEREYWASRCDAGYLSFRRQSQFGLGWSNVEYHAYECSRKHFHQYVRLFEMLGFQSQGMTIVEQPDRPSSESTGGGALTMKHPTLGAVVSLRVDMASTDANGGFGHVRLSPATWHGHSGLWCALHGESILDGGMSHIAARYDVASVRNLFEQEDVELLRSFGFHFTKSDRRAVDPRRVYALERQGHITRDLAEEFRMNGATATHLAIVNGKDFDRAAACAPEALFTSGPIEKPRRRRHRCKRPTHSRAAGGAIAHPTSKDRWSVSAKVSKVDDDS